MRLIVAITGASGVNLALRFIELIPKDIELFVVLSKSAKLALKYENNKTFKSLKNDDRIKVFKDKDIAAPIASGSFFN